MPVLRFKPGRVEEVLGLSLDEAVKLVERLKVEAEVTPDGYVEMEIEVDRPDMYTLEGIARQVRGLLGKELGLPSYNVVDSDLVLEVSDVASRPYIAAAVVWDVNVDEDYLEELIQFQEKLHVSLGGKRELVAIGLHDLDKLPSKKLRYVMVDVDSVKLIPLGHSQAMTLSKVLEETEQGRLYGSISLRGRLHPALFAGDEIISVPPVINAELTRIEPGTRHVFIDVTGTNKRLVLDTLAVLAANLAERSGTRRIGRVPVEAPWGRLREPTMEARGMSVSSQYASRVIGLELGAEEIAHHLQRMRFGAWPDEALVHVEVPRYRIDILHPVDLVEEIVLSIGVDRLEPVKPSRMLRGRLLPLRAWEREAKKLLVGMGFVETLSYSLVSCRKQEEIAGLNGEELVRLANPVGAESSCLRASMLPALLDIVRENQHYVPIKVFEIGETYRINKGVVDTLKKLTIVIADVKVGFEDIQAVVYGLVRGLDDNIEEVKPFAGKPFMEGRAARARTKHGLAIVFGELHPEILTRNGIEYPVVAAEIEYGSVSVPRP